jgi:Raf kinase inhibitor-like YbhB/YbcL family protein
MEEWAAESTEPIGLYTPHAAPMQLAWYVGDQFPQAYQGDAFVAMRGSWNRKPPSGYEVLRIRFEEGKPAGFEPFVTGFLMEAEDGWGHLGRLAGLAVAADGALLLADDTNGVIYRISYEGEQNPGQQAGPDQPTTLAGATVGMRDHELQEQTSGDTPDELAIHVLEAKSGDIEVTSPAFKDGEPIPAAYAAEQQNISPPLAWASGPQRTRTHALMLEDPYVTGQPPFVHWTMHNIPAGTTQLREGVPGDPRLVLPEGALQGANDRGSTGYVGMRPPKGEPAHRYHVQVFALDAELDLPHGATRAELLDAMKGGVVAKGELVGTYERP